MYNLPRIIQQAREAYAEVFEPSPTWEIKLSKAKTKLGTCNFSKQTIFLSKYYLEIMPEEKMVNTLIHEWLHVRNPKDSHDGGWLKDANKFNRTNYAEKYGRIKAKASIEEIETYFNVKVEKTYKYKVKCPQCGNEWGYHKMQKIVSQPHLYQCGKCKCKLERIEN